MNRTYNFIVGGSPPTTSLFTNISEKYSFSMSRDEKTVLESELCNERKEKDRILKEIQEKEKELKEELEKKRKERMEEMEKELKEMEEMAKKLEDMEEKIQFDTVEKVFIKIYLTKF